MSDRETKSFASSQKGRQIAGLGMWIVVLSALPFIANRWWNHPGVFLGLAGFYMVIAWVLRSRLVICTLAGIVFGLLTIDTNSRNTSEQYQVWQPVWSLGAGTLIGLVIGFVWDRGTSLPERNVKPDKKKR